MPTTPSGIIAVPKAKLRDLLAEVSALQSWFGASTVAAAKNKIFYSLATNKDLKALRPFAVVQWASYSLKKIAAGPRNELWPSGMENRLRVILQDIDRGGASVSEHTVSAAAMLEGDTIFENHLGAVVEGMADLAAVDDRLAINEIALEVPPTRNPVEEWASNGVHIWCSLLVGFE